MYLKIYIQEGNCGIIGSFEFEKQAEKLISCKIKKKNEILLHYFDLWITYNCPKQIKMVTYFGSRASCLYREELQQRSRTKKSVKSQNESFKKLYDYDR